MTNRTSDDDSRPGWARRIRAERQARRMSQAAAVLALRTHSSHELPSDSTLLRNWKRWEAGDAEPDDFYKPLVAKTLGTVAGSLFPRTRAERDVYVSGTSSLDTLEIVARLRSSDASTSTLDALHITADRLCSDYPHLPTDQLRVEGRAWLSRITDLLDRRLTLSQHRDVLSIAGWVALLVGCLEYDAGDKRTSDVTRRAAQSLGAEAGNAAVVGWAHEMQAWYALTQGDFRSVIAAADAGIAAAPGDGVAVQLLGQKAKAWARLGERRHVETALEQGRQLLESLPYPDNLDHHFVVDPGKFDFYAMDCYRLLGENDLAEAYANEVITRGTSFDGTERSPMRIAEARITLGVVAARRGDVDHAVTLGHRSLDGGRQSLPSLLMCSQELVSTLRERHPTHSDTAGYLDRLSTLMPR